jgi:glycogen debranching enzyme
MADITAAPSDIPLETSPFYVPVTATTSLHRPQALKADDSFFLADQHGDCGERGRCAEGLYHQDTRYLSRLTFALNGARPLLLSSKIGDESDSFRADLTNPDVYMQDRLVLERDTIHVLRSNQLRAGVLIARIEMRSFGRAPIPVELVTEFNCDFADIFEVRGVRRQQRGNTLTERTDQQGTTVAYHGLDGTARRCLIEFSIPADQVGRGRALHRFTLEPHGSAALIVTVTCQCSGSDSLQTADTAAASVHPIAKPELETSKELLNNWIARSQSDLNMLVSHTPHGPYPYAGIPWFSAPFGRDGIIAAMQCLWLRPDLARGVLAFLAATQAETFDSSVDAEPGKILHEARRGEMAILREVPFHRYYGSVDATPLFVMLAVAYWDRTGDWAFMRELWPNIQAALAWMLSYGDRDGDGFIEYARHTEAGLLNQGWKDSSDSIFHADGRLAEPPIALVEVQAYAYAAWSGAARLAASLGHEDEQVAFADRAESLRQRFEETFWCQELGSYALALDKAKQPCRVRASNAGHVLFAGLAAPERASAVAETLMSTSGFSGWGIRTIAEGEARYNPMSYHNGSVWPHDNALIAMGFARYGLRDALLALFEGMFATSQFMDLHRLPELFCGFRREPGEAPTRYPVACIPQAWSAAAVFGLLDALLGISFDPVGERIHVNRPVLPDYVDEVRISGLAVGEGEMDLLLRRHLRDVAVNVLDKKGDGELVLTSG